MPKLTLKFSIAVLLFCSITSAHAATLTSSVNRNSIKIDQTLTLTVSYSDEAPSSDLDLSELGQDFEILAISPSSNTSVSITNSQVTRQTTRQTTTTWTVTLAAKREGSLTIPAFEVGGEQSNPITIQINALTAEELAQPQPIEVSVTIDDADNLSIKPGEQILIEVELSAATNVGNIRGQELIVANANLESLGQQDGQRLENGVARQIAIWRYALFPNQSGEIIVPAQTFNGTVGGRTSFFNSFSRGGQPVGARSVEQTIIVDSQPDSNGNPWFPADDVSIESTWSGDTNQIRVGEPITRTITITATGQRASAIPPLVTPNTQDYKSYHDQPQLENTTSNLGLIGVRSESLAIVPAQEGLLTLAEQRISWWDNKADQWREAILPAETLNVLAAGIASTQNLQLPQAIEETTAFMEDTAQNKNTPSASSSASDWAWKIATMLLAGLVLIQFFLLRKQRRIQEPENNFLLINAQKKEQQTWKDLQNSLNRQDAGQVRHSILIWAQTALADKKATNFDSLIQLSRSATLRDQLNSLDKKLYGGEGEFDSEKLKAALIELRQELQTRKKKKTSHGTLAPLYPA